MGRQTRFKGVERGIARLLGCDRTGHLGGADAASPWLAVEVKTRRELPAWIHDAMRQSESHATDDQLAVVVLHEERQRYTEALLVMRVSAFVDWFGDGRPLSSEVAELVAAAADGDVKAREMLQVLAPDQVAP